MLMVGVMGIIILRMETLFGNQLVITTMLLELEKTIPIS